MRPGQDARLRQRPLQSGQRTSSGWGWRRLCPSRLCGTLCSSRYSRYTKCSSPGESHSNHRGNVDWNFQSGSSTATAPASCDRSYSNIIDHYAQCLPTGLSFHTPLSIAIIQSSRNILDSLQELGKYWQSMVLMIGEVLHRPWQQQAAYRTHWEHQRDRRVTWDEEAVSCG